MKPGSAQRLQHFFSEIFTAAYHRWGALLRWIVHPIFVFVALQIVWVAITLLWVFWFIDARDELLKLTAELNKSGFDHGYAVAFLVVGCVLLGVLLLGVVLLFIFGQKQARLIRQQRNFLSSVTHELRSPLASLQLGLETMISRNLSGENKARLLSMARNDTERLSRLVNQILISARLDRGLAAFDEIDVEETDANLIVSECVEKLTWMDAGLKERVRLVCQGGLTICTIRPALNLVFSNLLENAIKYSAKGTPIQIALRKSDGWVTLDVCDHGFGLEPKELRRIFKLFHRSDYVVAKAIPGTGVGLFIVKSMAKILGGRVEVESAGRGQGSCFRLIFPEKLS